MKTEIKREQLMEFIEKLKAGGFQVYAPRNMTTYAHFVKDDKIGYVERGDYGFNFSTVHKPCRECGTGYSIHRDVSYPTIEMAKDSLVMAPHWASFTDVQAIKKYKNWEDYTSYPQNKWSSQVEVLPDLKEKPVRRIIGQKRTKSRSRKSSASSGTSLGTMR